VLPPPLANVTPPSHKSPNQFLVATRTQTNITSSQILAFMPFSATGFTMELKTCSRWSLPLKPNGQAKTRLRATESHPIRRSPGMIRPMEFAGGAFRNLTIWSYQCRQAPNKSLSWLNRTLRTVAFIQPADHLWRRSKPPPPCPGPTPKASS
jgi:hypothetical protein